MSDAASLTTQHWRLRLRAFLERRQVTATILGVIIFNAITLGLSTSGTVTDEMGMGPILAVIDRTVLMIFAVELTLKLVAYGWSFFRNAWNIFDLLVVSVGFFPQNQGLSALRGLRVIRTLRILSVVPQMRAVVQALLDALPGMGAVIVMLSVVYYVFAVMATIMYGATFPDWFGSIGASFYSLFQIMTLESWSMGIVRPVMEVHPYAWAFFMPFIVVTAFSVLNLFIGLLVATMQSAVEEEGRADLQATQDLVRSETDEVADLVMALHEEIRGLRREINELKETRNG